MFNLLKRLFGGNKREIRDSNSKVATETKKCLNCLRRVELEKTKCPFCRSDNFQF